MTRFKRLFIRGKSLNHAGHVAKNSVEKVIAWIGGWHAALVLLLLFIVLEVAALSVERAAWVSPQPSLTLTLFVAIVAAVGLAKAGFRSSIRNTIAAVTGAALVISQSAGAAHWAVRGHIPVVNQLQGWWYAVLNTRPNDNPIHFSIFIVAVIYAIGFISSWFLLRKKNPWLAVSLGAVVSVINLSNLAQKDYFYFFLFMVCAALLIGQVNWTKRFGKAPVTAIAARRKGTIYFVTSLAALSLLTTGLSWYLPQARFGSLEKVVSANTPQGEDMDRYWANIFAAVPRKVTFMKSQEQEQMAFGTVFDIGEEVQYIIAAESPHYWRLRAYDVYNSEDWTNSADVQQVASQGKARNTSKALPGQNLITYKVTPAINTDILLVAGNFVSADISGFNRIQLAGQDTISVTSSLPLRAGERYTVSSAASQYGVEELSQAGTTYPSWVSDRYTQLPATVPDRVKRLASRIVANAGARTPYQKALAINSYLSSLTYSLDIKTPPRSADAVDYFLFVQKSGNCGYFASAMAVMLRSVGVPARLAVGYLPGDIDQGSGSYVIKTKHYHAWPEVYFPGPGWVEAERLPLPTATGDDLESVSTSGYVGYIEDQWYYIDAQESASSSESTVIGGPIQFPPWFYPMVLSLFAMAILAGSAIVALTTTFNRWLWDIKGPDPITAIYARICFMASIVGLAPKPQQTPLEYSAVLAREYPHQAGSISYIVGLYLDSRFGGKQSLEAKNDVKLLKARTDVFQYLMQKAGPLKYLFRKR